MWLSYELSWKHEIYATGLDLRICYIMVQSSAVSFVYWVLLDHYVGRSSEQIPPTI